MNTLLHSVAVLFVFALAHRGHSQTGATPAEGVMPVAIQHRLDTAAVLRIAGMRMEEDQSEMEWPQLRMNEAGNWQATQVRVGHTNAGRCRRTNGCTVLRTRYVVIDDRTGRVLSRKRTKSVMANYE